MSTVHHTKLVTEAVLKRLINEGTRSNTLQALIGLMQDEKRKYALVGGAAIAAHGVPRAIRDFDVVIDRLPSPKAAVAAGFTVTRVIKTSMMEMEHESGVHVDILTAYTQHEVKALKRRVKGNIMGIDVAVAPRDVLIAMKTEIAQQDPTRTRKDMQDVKKLSRT